MKRKLLHIAWLIRDFSNDFERQEALTNKFFATTFRIFGIISVIVFLCGRFCYAFFAIACFILSAAWRSDR